MAGVKGRSGGKRPGAGRPPKNASAPPADKPATVEDPEQTAQYFLRRVMLGQVVPTVPQLDAAKTLARLEAGPARGGGKKAEAAAKARAVATGRFRAAPAPLKVVGGRGG